MASLILQDGKFSLQFFSAERTPQRKRVPLRVRVKRDAETVRRKLERDHALGTFDPWTDDPFTYDRRDAKPERVGEAHRAFIEAKAHRSAKTIHDYDKTLARFAAFVGVETPVCQMSAANVERWLDSTDAGDVSRKTYTRTLQVFFRWAKAEGLTDSVATEAVRLRKVPRKFARFLTQSEVDAIVSTVRTEAKTAHWLADLIPVAVHTGLRRGELVSLTWDAVDLCDRVLTVANTDTFTTKSGAERRVPLSETAVSVLARMSETRGASPFVFTTASGQLTDSYLSHAFLKYARLAGVDNCHLHHLRHTAISWLAQRGVPVEAIRRFAGHSSITVTERYMHVGDDLYSSAILKAFGA